MTRSARLALLALLLASPVAAQTRARPDDDGRARREATARQVTIVRDRFGVPHVYGPTDASVHFGMMYAQAEDAFWSLEERQITALGRRAELYGEGELLRDATVRAFGQVARAQAQYARMRPALRALLQGAADGVNHWIDRNPGAPRLLRRWEPWHFLVPEAGWNLAGRAPRLTPEAAGLTPGAVATDAGGAVPAHGGAAGEDAVGSNAWAVAPSRTAEGHALLFINPHWLLHGPSGRLEVHLHSREGLRFSGFGMIGTGRVHAGHNGRLGWGSTVLATDLSDVWSVTFDHPTDRLAYRYAGGWRRATEWTDSVRVRTPAGMQTRRVTLRRTHHGPVVALRPGGRAIVVRHVDAETGGTPFEQLTAMARARTHAEWRRALALRYTGGSNHVYADADGHIALVAGGAVPRRPPGVNPADTLDGSDPATEWRGLHALEELPQLLDPAGGYVQNANATPFRATAEGGGNPDSAAFAPYLAPRTDNHRARNSRRILEGTARWTWEEWTRAATDRHVFAAGPGVPALAAEWERLRAAEPARAAALAPLVDTLRAWDRQADTTSVATTLFVYAFVNELLARRRAPADTAWLRVRSLEAARDSLAAVWGRWEVPWGRVNRVQRIHPSYAEPFREDRPSWAVPNTAGDLGTIANLYTTVDRQVRVQGDPPSGAIPNTSGRTQYGVAGNTYVAVVQFAPRVRARSLLVFGQSEDPASPHHLDQAELYAAGRLKPAPFHPDEVEALAARAYHPGGPDLPRARVPAWAHAERSREIPAAMRAAGR